MRDRLSVIGIIGLALGAASSALFLAAVFLPYFVLDPGTNTERRATFWHVDQRVAVAVIVLSIAAAVLFLLPLLIDARVLLVGAALCVGMNAAALLLDTPLATSSTPDWQKLFDVAPYVAVGRFSWASLAYWRGSLAGRRPLTLNANRTAGRRGPRSRLPDRYPDPSGQARERLWAGEHWTSEAR